MRGLLLPRLWHVLLVVLFHSLCVGYIGVPLHVCTCTIMLRGEGTRFFLYHPKPKDAMLVECSSCQLASNLLILVLLLICGLSSVFFYSVQFTINFLFKNAFSFLNIKC